MASNIKFKRSAVQNRVPTTAQLELGELALNTYDGKLYTEINTGSASVVEIGSKLSSLVVDGDNGGGNGDVVFHGATAGRDLTWDASADSLIFNDNTKLVLGTSSDGFQLYHNGNNSLIQDTGTGHIQIRSGTFTVGNSGLTKTSAVFNSAGAQNFYHNNSVRIATTDDGADVSGTGSLKLPVGTTAQRNSSPTAGDMRYNSTTGSFEGYTTGWGALGGESGVGIGSTTVNPGSGVVNPLIGVGYTTINFVGAGLSVTGYGTTIVVDLGGAVSRKYGRKIHAYTATANQTTFAGLSYTNAAAQISVYLNGAKLSAATYTATSGSTVVLGTGASVGDEVEIICIDSGVDLTRNVTSYTATANQTTFTGLGYSDGGDLDVYLNGIRLAQSDYTANNGTSLVLAAGASVGDLLEVVDMGQGAQWSSGFGADADDIYRLNGGVGIGTTNPTDKLNIVGNAEVIGVLTATSINGNIVGGTVSGTTGTFSSTVSVNGGNLDINDSIRHIGDTDTKIRFSSADTIKLETGGSPRVTVTDATTTVANNLTVTGNLQVDGTNTVVNSTTMTVDDKNIVLASGAANDAAADGGGITLESGNGNKTFNWVDATDAWTSSEHIQIAAGKQLGFADDTNTYIDRPAADTIRFTTGGSERIRIDSNGRLMVGQNSAYAATGTGNMMLTVTKDATSRTDVAINNQNSGDNASAAVVLATHGQDYILEATGSGNTTDGVRAFRILKGTSERLRIDSSGNIGINQSAPEALLHIEASSSGASYTADAADTLILERNGGCVIDFRTPAANDGGLIFSDNSARAQGTLLYQHSDNSLRFGTAGGERLRITSAGRVGINQASPSAMLQVDYDYNNSEVGLWLRAASGSGTKTWQLSEINGNAGVFTIRNATNSINALNIDASGYVGLNGFTTPSGADGWGRHLVVGSTTSHGGITIRSGNDNNEYGHLLFADGTGGTADQEGRIGYHHYDNSMYFATNNSVALTIDSSGRVLIAGTDANANAGADDLIVGTTSGSDSHGITIKSPTNKYGRLYFADGNSHPSWQVGQIEYNHSDNSLNIYTGGHKGFVINSAGGHSIFNNNAYAAANLAECNSGEIAINIRTIRSGQTKGIAIGAIGTNSQTGLQAYDSSDNSANNFVLNPFGGGLGIGLGAGVEPDETLHLKASGSYTAIEIQSSTYKAQIGMRGNDLEIRGSNGQMEFYTGNADGASSTERMRIKDDGKVGMSQGANVPLQALHILDNHNSSWDSALNKSRAVLRLETHWNAQGQRAVDDYGGGIVFNHLGGHSAQHNDDIHAFIGLRVHSTPGHETSKLVFATNNQTDSSDHDAGAREAMHIKPDGAIHMAYGTNDVGSTSNIERQKLTIMPSINSGNNYDDNHILAVQQYNGNWEQGTSGADTSFGLGWMWSSTNGGQQNQRAGIAYDHKGTEQFKIWSSYGAICFYTDNGTSGNETAETCDTHALRIEKSGDVNPGVNNSQDLGSSSLRWRNLYTMDLQLSNESGDGNDVDGTTGNYTIQEGEDNLYLINNKSGKKYKFNLTEVH